MKKLGIIFKKMLEEMDQKEVKDNEFVDHQSLWFFPNIFQLHRWRKCVSRMQKRCRVGVLSGR